MKLFAYVTLAGALALATVTAKEVGKSAPNFSVQDVSGKTVSLADYKGKVVVLEWFNPGCPFVQKHYQSGNMPKLQETYKAKDVIWLTISSANKTSGAFLEPSKLAEAASGLGNKATEVLVDADSNVGKNLYEAKTTPHMFIVNKEGTLVYSGAIDSIPSSDEEDIAKADKLFANALDNVLAGKPVENAKNMPYGCGVKY